MKNPYTKIPGYRYAKYDPLNGWFVVQSTLAPGLGFGPAGRMPYAVTSIERRQVIYAPTLVSARGTAVNAADGCHLDKWDYAFRRAGAGGTPAYQDYL